eukprot:TRINITY_DN7034_c0_g2_i1.p5 TRINITY_DN7034_c0_g2~~TRINITY_DN7034_c0_g2_i1.p5  ORF type:complete len:160 (-),score=47.28 TRINITY_DN7034_c0_g2_i1:894-1373(-)
MTVLAVGCLAYAHVVRMVARYGSWDLGITTTLMILCIHLCSLGWNYVDGEVDPGKLTRDQQKHAIRETPSFLEFFAAGIGPTQCFAGPCSNFVDFKNYVYGTDIYAGLPSTFAPCMKRFLRGWTFVGFYLGIQAFYSSKFLASPQFVEANFFVKASSSL